jgi:hypothetical protein
LKKRGRPFSYDSTSDEACLLIGISNSIFAVKLSKFRQKCDFLGVCTIRRCWSWRNPAWVSLYKEGKLGVQRKKIERLPEWVLRYKKTWKKIKSGCPWCGWNRWESQNSRKLELRRLLWGGFSSYFCKVVGLHR